MPFLFRHDSRREPVRMKKRGKDVADANEPRSNPQDSRNLFLHFDLLSAQIPDHPLGLADQSLR